MPETIDLQAEVPGELAGGRLDLVATQLFSGFSRGRLQGWIRDGCLTVNGGVAQPRHKVVAGDRLHIATRLQPAEEGWVAEAMDLDLVHEDDDLLVLNKPAGLVVHPAAGHRRGTLLNGVLHHCPALAGLPRAGIVHRLDKDTSGLLVVAKTLAAHQGLVAQLQQRAMGREYEAVVHGVLTGGGRVDAPIGRHPLRRQRQAVVKRGKPAVTHYRVLQRFRAHSHIGLRLETGRTHQIRVHTAHIQHPIVGDPIYGGRLRLPAGASPALRDVLQQFRRQALHACRLALQHPISGEAMQWEAPPPADFQQLLSHLCPTSPY